MSACSDSIFYPAHGAATGFSCNGRISPAIMRRSFKCGGTVLEDGDYDLETFIQLSSKMGDTSLAQAYDTGKK